MIPYSPEALETLRAWFEVEIEDDVDVAAVTCRRCETTAFIRLEPGANALFQRLLAHIEAHTSRLPIELAVKGPPPKGLAP